MRRWLAFALCFGSMSLAAVTPAHAASAPLPADGTILVPGHGWGHGRGMGQYGAKGMAARGRSYAQILTTYYSGVSLTTRSASEDIRVLVEDRSVDVVVTSDDMFKISTSTGTAIASSDATYRFWRARYDGDSYVVEKSTYWKGPWTLVRSGGSAYIVFTRGTKLLQLVADNSHVNLYRGKILARTSPYGGMRAIDQLMMQEYLYGVVPREMPPSWPAEAVKSQAVAARTYAAYKKDYARSKGYPYDICTSSSCQSYLGYASKSSPSGSQTNLENSASNAAVDATAGKVVYYGGKPILAEYSSSTGGYTAPGSVAYQKAVPDPDDSVSPYHNWRGVVRVSDVQAKYPSIGRLVDIVVTKRNGYGDWGGRVLSVELRGTSATQTLSGDGFRSAFSSKGVRSSWFVVQYWRGALVSAPASMSIPAGDAATIVVQVRDSGSTSWDLGSYVRLATPSPSRFHTSAWISTTEASSVVRNVTAPSSSRVAPGQVAEFRVPLSTEGVAPGLYSETFRAVAHGYSTMDPAFKVQIQVLNGWTDEAANLLTNASFESGLTPWKASGFSSGDGRSTASHREGSYALRLTGSGSQSVSQHVAFTGGARRRFTLGGWNKTDGTSSSGGPIEIRASVRYTDSTTASSRLSFARGSHAWAYDEISFATSASKQLSEITVSASLADQRGDAFFDALRLEESPVVNPSFEDGLAGWGAAGFAAGDGVTQASSRDGYRSLVLNGGGTKSAGQFATLSARPIERLVVSAWNRSVSTTSSGGAPRMTVTLVYTDGTKAAVAYPFSASPHDWTRGELVVKAAKDLRSIGVTVASANPSGSTFFDGIRVARTWTTNPSFEAGLKTWTPHGFTSDDGVVASTARDGASSLRLAGSGQQNVWQSLGFSGGAGKKLVVSGWSRTVGTSSSSGRIELLLTFLNADGTRSSIHVPFSRSAHPWTYLERTVSTPKRFSGLVLYVVFYDQKGTALFDAVQVRSA